MREFEGFKKGINLGGWLSQCCHRKVHYDTFITEADIKQIAVWGLDHVRLPIDFELIEPEEGVYSEDGFGYIDRCIEWCRCYNLNVILDLHKTAGYVFHEQINNGTEKASFFLENEELIQRFLNLWKFIARRYQDDTKMLAFEILNEMVDPSGGIAWNRLAKRAYETIREILPNAKIIIGSNMWNSIHTLKYMDKPYDENVIYTFHFYEPMLFTHQKAAWVDAIPKDVDVYYPDAIETYQRLADRIGQYEVSNETTDKMDITYLEEIIKIAVITAEEYNVPLYCGEYGVINQADPKSTLNWYRDFHQLMEKYNIGRASWTYKEKDFGIQDAHLDSVREQILQFL